MKSGLFSLKAKDWLRGLLLAVVVPALVALQQSLEAGALTINWKELTMSSIAALIAYVIKNFFTDDTMAAVKTVEKAGGTVIDSYPKP